MDPEDKIFDVLTGEDRPWCTFRRTNHVIEINSDTEIESGETNIAPLPIITRSLPSALLYEQMQASHYQEAAMKRPAAAPAEVADPATTPTKVKNRYVSELQASAWGPFKRGRCPRTCVIPRRCQRNRGSGNHAVNLTHARNHAVLGHLRGITRSFGTKPTQRGGPQFAPDQARGGGFPAGWQPRPVRSDQATCSLQLLNVGRKQLRHLVVQFLLLECLHMR
jgi:hypothetical protein